MAGPHKVEDRDASLARLPPSDPADAAGGGIAMQIEKGERSDQQEYHNKPLVSVSNLESLEKDMADRDKAVEDRSGLARPSPSVSPEKQYEEGERSDRQDDNRSLLPVSEDSLESISLGKDMADPVKAVEVDVSIRLPPSDPPDSKADVVKRFEKGERTEVGVRGDHGRPTGDNTSGDGEVDFRLASIQSSLSLALDIDRGKTARRKICEGKKPMEKGGGIDAGLNNPSAASSSALKAVPDPALVEADHDGDWYKGIERRDCLSLMRILGAVPGEAGRARLCWKTGSEGRTVLHVAAMQGCFKLAKRVTDLISTQHPLTDEDKNKGDDSFTSVLKGFCAAEDGRSGLSALVMADDVIGNTSIVQYFEFVGNERKHDHPVLFDAYPGTEWHTALAEGDCKMLHMLLRCNSRYLLQTCNGFSVLDVAIWKNNEELVKMVTAFGRENKVSWNKDFYFPAELSWELMTHCYPKDGSSALLKMTEKEFGIFRRAVSAMDLAEKLRRPEVIKVLLEAGKYDGDLTLFEEEISKSVVLKINEMWDPEWNEGFEADVDYNFEEEKSRRSILQLHHAWKDPQKFLLFLLGTWLNNLCEEEKTYLRVMHDGQGRALIHTLVDYFNHTTFPMHILFDMEFYFYSYDSRGRSYLLRAITKNYLENKTKDSAYFDRFSLMMMLSGNSIGYGKGFTKVVEWHGKQFAKAVEWHISSGFVIFDLWLFQAAILFQDQVVLRYIFDQIGKDECKILENFQHEHQCCKPRPFLIAAASANSSILRLLLKMKFDPMIVDARGRSSLHYAAHASPPKFYLPDEFYCSIDDRRKVKEKWTKENKDDGHKIKEESNVDQIIKSTVGRRACILMLLQAGVDLSQEDENKDIPDPGPTSDVSFQSWWYDNLVKDTVDKKMQFNQAGNALSVVGTLVAATSYIGPLQPPLNYNDTGYVETSKLLVKVFMVSNTLAFYLAVASVMFAVVPSLPMPQEGVIDELRRARHTVSSSLCLLLVSIGCILISFAAASAVVVENNHPYGSNDFLLSPSIIGWIFCLIAIISFFIRVMRLIFYRSTTMRHIYKFSFSDFCKKKRIAIQTRLGRYWKSLRISGEKKEAA